MTYEPLHHKYRPQTFAELVGQEAIAATLTNALRQQKIAPAYLFTGARGTGKTSSARIFAKSLNCQQSDTPTETPCGVCDVCRAIANGSALDVIEIDAASNTGVDNIRELIERSQFAPVQCRYKVYVIDECHMLSTAAFNALLKTLEEPPPHVVFVLATTDPQRVLPTIISRCQRFDFRRIPLESMTAHLTKIADKEAIAISPDAVQLVAQISQGGLRDAESLLDQLSLLEGEISVEKVWDLVGAVPERDLLAVLRAIAADDPEALIERVRHLMDRGREPLIVLQNLGSFYRDLLIAKTAPQRNDLVSITPPTWNQVCEFVQSFETTWILEGQRHLRAAEVQIKNTTQPRLWLEVTLMGLLPTAMSTTPLENAAVQPPVSPSQLIKPPAPKPLVTPAPISPSGEKPAEAPAEPVVEALPPTPLPSSPITAAPAPEPAASAAATAAMTNLAEIWQTVLGLVQPNSTQILLRQQCRLLGFDGQVARIGVTAQPLLGMAKSKLSNIEAAFAKYANQAIRVTLEVSPVDEAETASATVVQPPVQPPHRAQPTASQELSPQPPVQPVSVPQTSPAIAPQPPSEPPVPTPPTPKQATPAETPLPSTSPAPQDWEAEDEVLRAARSLAQMFSGQIVKLHAEKDIDSQISGDDTAIAPSHTSGDTDDDDDDVPF
ncbi:MAG TPA: DNA polymerase III subunit gamma/tau [Synechococcales cyanobacterium M55_K2018_004]|nr:DNA polymerase III subunit gamma/tau [Synechococcales cyanobacterium M55_K2018_004]